MDTNIVMLLVSTAPVASYKNVFLDNKFALPSLPTCWDRNWFAKCKFT